nr:immunoglobulin light chain junction region [Macaca mulatta]MPN86714.1 immunoglobulin light chain junction region [Macaca mulatta]MPN86743.1 immunoglobulin light chain junction region [Macaca mulatta]MPN86752.1 immunoglobulin light chain junction region [Macaca mulatta]MPN86795.1 immunoglobulin light chain junction region [Macaca mulatta]
CMQGIQFPFTF